MKTEIVNSDLNVNCIPFEPITSFSPDISIIIVTSQMVFANVGITGCLENTQMVLAMTIVYVKYSLRIKQPLCFFFMWFVFHVNVLRKKSINLLWLKEIKLNMEISGLNEVIPI